MTEVPTTHAHRHHHGVVSVRSKRDIISLLDSLSLSVSLSISCSVILCFYLRFGVSDYLRLLTVNKTHTHVDLCIIIKYIYIYIYIIYVYLDKDYI